MRPGELRPADLAGRDVAVWGTGREGAAAADALRSVGARVRFVEDGSSDPTRDPATLSTREVLLLSPGVSRYDPRVVALREAGATVTTGSALWLAEHAAATTAVTGSKGKSTTSALTHHLLQALGLPTEYGGNIGTPLLALPAAERYVVELSSYQCSELTTSPRAVGLTSLFPEHLDWHGGAERYYADKLNVIAHGPHTVVYNALDARLTSWVARYDVPTVPVGRSVDRYRVAEGRLTVDGVPVLPVADLPVPGDHNAGNALVALALLAASGVDVPGRRAEVADALLGFAGLPHRLRTIASVDGVDYVDDSLSTAPQATVAALRAFPEGPVGVLVGGQDRGVDYDVLREHVRTDPRDYVVVGLPDSGARIVATLAGLPHVRTAVAGDLAVAVAVARDGLPEGGTVLLSPGAPSYGVFRDHVARARAFAAAVATVTGTHPAG